MNTLIIQIGNSDNKLSQDQWCLFIIDIDTILNKIGYNIHFRGFSNPDAPYQNGCWVMDDSADPEHARLLKKSLELCRKKYNQHSIAVTRGTTTFY